MAELGERAGPAPGRSGVVSFLSDFGRRDPYVGIVHGVLWREAPGLRAVVDLTHELPPQDVRRAGFFLERSYRWFPPGSVHLAVVDPGVGTERAILMVESEEQILVAPDNGLADAVLAADPAARTHALDAERLGLAGGSRTFHGRDRFAPLVARLVGGLDPAQAGPPLRRRPAAPAAGVEPAEGGLRTRVLFPDRYGNLVLGARRADVPWPRFEARLAGRRARLVETYAEGGRDELVCLLDSYGHFELAVNGASAAERTGAVSGAAVELRPEETR